MSASKGTADAIDDDVQPEIDYCTTHAFYSNAAPLRLPQDGDTLTAIAEKLQAIVAVISKGQSIALATKTTNNCRAVDDITDPHSAAAFAMSDEEAEHHSRFVSEPLDIGRDLATIDWSTAKIPLADNVGEDDLDKLRWYARALDELRDAKDSTLENVLYVLTNRADLTTLLLAEIKFQVAKERQFSAESRKAMDGVEMSVVDDVVLAMEQHLDTALGEFRRDMMAITASVNMLSGYKKALMNKHELNASSNEPLTQYTPMYRQLYKTALEASSGTARNVSTEDYTLLHVGGCYDVVERFEDSMSASARQQMKRDAAIANSPVRLASSTATPTANEVSGPAAQPLQKQV